MKQYTMRKEGGSDIVRNHNGKGHYIRNRIFFLLAVTAAGWIGTGGAAALAAQGGTVGCIHSTGRVQCGQAVFDSADLRTVCTHIDEQKRAAAEALIRLGTRFRQQPEGYVYDRNPDVCQEEIDMGQFEWAMLVRAAAESQTVPTGLPVLNPEAVMHIEGVEERTEHYETAIEDNISRGKAAWADGRLLLGNGADNDRAYRKGTEDGSNGDVPENFYPIFAADESSVEVRHVHVGKPENRDGISGCYKNSHIIRETVSICGAQLVKTDPAWYPNPEEPDGGSWHGGEYTCSYHGGIYHAPGTCTYQDRQPVTVWKHEVVCGFEDCLYAVLTVRGTDTDYYDRAIVLTATLEEGEGYGNLSWQEGDRFVWTDAGGSVVGTGPEYTAREAGAYRCHLNIANADADQSEVSVTVRKTGLVVRGY